MTARLNEVIASLRNQGSPQQLRARITELNELLSLAQQEAVLCRERLTAPQPFPNDVERVARSDNGMPHATYDDLGDLTQHGTNCNYQDISTGAICSCGLHLRRDLATERTMHAAWRKRAEEAEHTIMSRAPQEPVNAQMLEALKECVEQLWHLAKDPATNALIQEARAAIAAAEAAPKDEWQPISTAPKDKWVWIFVPSSEWDGAMQIGQQGPAIFDGENWFWSEHAPPGRHSQPIHRNYPPSGWRPLPAPPPEQEPKK